MTTTPKHKITARFPNGVCVTRTTEAAYTHASMSGTTEHSVRFHSSRAAARKAAGRYGDVVATDYRVAVVAGPASSVWCARWADGSSDNVNVPEGTNPMVAAQAAHPGKVFAGAKRVR